MLFAHDTEVALTFAAMLVNTAYEDPGPLDTRSGLDALLREYAFTGSRTNDEGELRAVRSLRPQLRKIWTAGEDDAVRMVNSLLADAKALPQLVKHDGWDYHLHATTPEAPLATRMAVEAAMALVDVIRSKEMDRLGVCQGAGCDNVLIDLSRNKSRRFCDISCGNRAHVAAYRARRASRA